MHALDDTSDAFSPTVHLGPEVLPCPSPECSHMPAASDRYCDACGTWLGVDGERPPTTGPLKKILLNTGALRIVSMVERAEESLNDWCL
jgi:hypothetical protein